jgi:hypothetical protein
MVYHLFPTSEQKQKDAERREAMLRAEQERKKEVKEGEKKAAEMYKEWLTGKNGLKDKIKQLSTSCNNIVKLFESGSEPENPTNLQTAYYKKKNSIADAEDFADSKLGKFLQPFQNISDLSPIQSTSKASASLIANLVKAGIFTTAGVAAAGTGLALVPVAAVALGTEATINKARAKSDGPVKTKKFLNRFNPFAKKSTRGGKKTKKQKNKRTKNRNRTKNHNRTKNRNRTKNI